MKRLRTALPAAALSLLSPLLLAGCSGPSKPVTAAPSQPDFAPATVFAVVYRCPDGTVFTTFPRGESAQVDFANRSAGTPGAETGSAKCVGTDAKDVWEAAKLRGVTLRAVGSDPSWLLEVTPGRELVFARDYGASHLTAPAPAPRVDAAAGITAYDAKTASGDLHVEIRGGGCNAVPGKNDFTASATVSLGGTTWKGCARTP